MKLEEQAIKRNSKDAKDRFVKGYIRPDEKAIDRENRTISGLASTIWLDRDDEIILPRAFEKTLDTFQAGTSPFLAAHVHRTADATPSQIGWVMEMAIREISIPCRFRFGLTKAAEDWWLLASDPKGKGIAFSIGFIPVRRIYGSVADLIQAFPELKPVFARAGLAEDRRVVVYTEIELLEISAVPVGSNREALQVLGAKLAKAFGYEEADGEQAIDLLAAKLAERLRSDVVETTLEVSESPIEGQLKSLQEQLSQYHEQILSCLPDDVDAGGGPPPVPEDGDRDPGPDAGGGEPDRGSCAEAAKALREKLK